MPTRRAWTLLALTLLFYVLANQTQTGWLYLMSNGLLGLLGVLFVYSWRSLAPLEGEWTVGAVGAPAREVPLFREDDPIEVTLRVVNHGGRVVAAVRGVAPLPFAPPEEQAQPFFVPLLMPGQSVSLRLTTHCDRRGLHRWEGLPLQSSGPFGLFRTQRTLGAAGDLLVYPAYSPLTRRRWMEGLALPQRQAARAGAGSEVIGVREYRPGDPPRLVHWPSSARSGRLIVKELAGRRAAHRRGGAGFVCPPGRRDRQTFTLRDGGAHRRLAGAQRHRARDPLPPHRLQPDLEPAAHPPERLGQSRACWPAWRRMGPSPLSCCCAEPGRCRCWSPCSPPPIRRRSVPCRDWRGGARACWR